MGSSRDVERKTEQKHKQHGIKMMKTWNSRLMIITLLIQYLIRKETGEFILTKELGEDNNQKIWNGVVNKALKREKGMNSFQLPDQEFVKY